jgi:hypothetical protein
MVRHQGIPVRGTGSGSSAFFGPVFSPGRQALSGNPGIQDEKSRIILIIRKSPRRSAAILLIFPASDPSGGKGIPRRSPRMTTILPAHADACYG